MIDIGYIFGSVFLGEGLKRIGTEIGQKKVRVSEKFLDLGGVLSVVEVA